MNNNKHLYMPKNGKVKLEIKSNIRHKFKKIEKHKKSKSESLTTVIANEKARMAEKPASWN